MPYHYIFAIVFRIFMVVGPSTWSDHVRALTDLAYSPQTHRFHSDWVADTNEDSGGSEDKRSFI